MAGRIIWLSDCGKGYSRNSPLAVRAGGVVDCVFVAVAAGVPGCVTFACPEGWAPPLPSATIVTTPSSSKTSRNQILRRRVDRREDRDVVREVAIGSTLVSSTPLFSSRGECCTLLIVLSPVV